jgi:hypothetical protein
MRKILVVDWDGTKLGSWMYDTMKAFKDAKKAGHYDTVKVLQVLEVTAKDDQLSVLRKHPK